MPEQPPLKVFYDAACPICRRERSRYESWAGEAGETVTWADVNTHETRLRERGVTPQEALLSLHVEDHRGRLVEGIDAYVLLMERVPRLRPFAWLIDLPGVKAVLTWVYRRWVRRRLAREGRLP